MGGMWIEEINKRHEKFSTVYIFILIFMVIVDKILTNENM